MIVIGRRFPRPPEAGQVATHAVCLREIDGPAAVTVHVAPPLKRQLALELGDDDRLLLRTGANPVH